MSGLLKGGIQLNNGVIMPAMGLGTWEIPRSITAKVIEEALNVGYRCIDTAVLYGNERECGEGITNWLLKNPNANRSDIFYITKLWNNQNGYERAQEAINECLNKVSSLKYIDLLLIHSPTEGPHMRLETWKAMQEAVNRGLVKSIGVSNYGEAHLKELLNWDQLEIKPVVNEIEVSPWCMRQDLCDFTRSLDIQVIAYAPLSHSFRLQDPDAIKVAKNHGVSTAQVLIKWSLQKGYIPIPKTKTIERLAVNFQLDDFQLTPNEMAILEHPLEHDPSDWEVTTCP